MTNHQKNFDQFKKKSFKKKKSYVHNHSTILDGHTAQSRLQCIAKISTFAFDGWSSLVACPWFGSMTVVWLIVPIMINQHFFRRFYRLAKNLYVYIQIRVFAQMCARTFLPRIFPRWWRWWRWWWKKWTASLWVLMGFFSFTFGMGAICSVGNSRDCEFIRILIGSFFFCFENCSSVFS